MTERSDIYTVWESSPRLLEVDTSTTTQLDVQDLHDTCKSNTLQAGENDDSLDSMDDDPLIDSAGKENLGSGVEVGITSTLLNSQIAFTRDYAPVQSGTATSIDLTGTILKDTAAQFITNGVERAAWIINLTDGSVCEVLTIDSETQLTTRVLREGINNDWEVNDSYKIWNVKQCEVSGGNLVAIDDVGGDLATVFPTFATQVIRTSASSATTQSLATIERVAFEGGIWMDEIDGTPGTTYPQGTPSSPVDNLADAIAIRNSTGIPRVLFIIGDLDAGNGDALTGWQVYGKSTENHVHLDPGSAFTDCGFHDLHIHGELFGTTQMHDCELGHVTGFSGELMYCTLEDKIEVEPGAKALIFGCFSAPDMGTAEIDCGGTSVNTFVEQHSGALLISGVTTGMAHIHMQSGKVTLDSTCVGGMVMVADGTSLDASAASCMIDASNLISAQIRDVTYAIESARRSHKAYGETFYVEVTVGNSAFDGTTEDTPKATIAQAQALCVDGRGDIIQVINKQAAAVEHTEDVTVTKNGIHLRLPDRDFEWRGTANGTILTVNGNRCSLEGGYLNANDSSDYCIQVNGHQFLMIKPWLKKALINNIEYRSGSYHEAIDGEIEKAAGANIKFTDVNGANGAPREVTFIGTESRFNVYDGSAEGIAIDDDGISDFDTTRIIRFIGHCNVQDNALYGITSGQYTKKILIGRGTHVHNNNGDHEAEQFNLLGEVHNELVEGPHHISEEVWENTGRKLKDVIESQRGRHTAQGDIYYVGPYTGVDDPENGSKDAPVATVQYALNTLVTDNNHDLIILLADNPAGKTLHNEQITCDKSYTFIRGPGTDFLWSYDSPGDVITITADGVELSGFEGATHTSGNGNLISVDDSNAYKLHHIHCNYSRKGAIEVVGGSRGEIHDNNFHETGQNGSANTIELNGLTQPITHTIVCNNTIASATGDAIAIRGSNCEDNQIHHNHINNSSAYGINNQNAVRTALTDNRIGNSGTAPINDSGTDTMIGANNVPQEVWEYDIRTTPGADTAASKVLLDANKILKNKIITDPIAGTITVYDDDDTVLFTAPLWENVAGTQGYRAQGSDRRDRLT